MWGQFLTAFTAIFLAEMGDKTQIAIISMAASSRRPFSVFLGGSIALVLLTAIGAIAGDVVIKYIPASVLSKAAAVLFVAIGIWTWIKG